MMDEQLTVNLAAGIIVATVRGEPTEDLLRRCQDQILTLAHASGCTRVLYDALAMQPPPVDVPWSQQALDERVQGVRLRRAVVVPSTRLAYLARLAFGDGDYRVFYDDRSAAMAWLQRNDS
jgi:hypothetical protein